MIQSKISLDKYLSLLNRIESEVDFSSFKDLIELEKEHGQNPEIKYSISKIYEKMGLDESTSSERINHLEMAKEYIDEAIRLYQKQNDSSNEKYALHLKKIKNLLFSEAEDSFQS